MKAPDPLLVLVGMELGDLRNARGWTLQDTVTELRDNGLATTAQSLRGYEDGLKVIPLDRLKALCALYGVPSSVLLAAAERRAGIEDRCPMCRRPT